MSDIVCKACGAQVSSASKFCTGCGGAIPEGQAEQQVHTSSPQRIQESPLPRAAVDTAPMSVIGYVFTMLAFSVPILGLVLAFRWAFRANTGLNRRNFARAMLVMWGLVVVLGIAAFLLGGDLVFEFGTGIN